MGFGESDTSISCSICLEIVAAGAAGGDRSTARLHCGHEFHLDCIGSAFNAKGVMQCPNCRKVENGNWRFANGYHSQLPQLGFDDWSPEEEFYELSYTEVSFDVLRWCPAIGGLAQVPSSFESGSRIPRGSFISSLVPQYTGNSQSHTHVRDHYQPRSYPSSQRGPIYPSQRRPGRPGSASVGLPPVGPTPVSLPEQVSYYLFPPTAAASSSRSRQERDQFAQFPVRPVNRDGSWWPPRPPHSNNPPDSSSRVGGWHRNGSDRPSSQQGRTDTSSSYRPSHGSRQTRR